MFRKKSPNARTRDRSKDVQKIEQWKQILSKSPTGKFLLEFAEKAGVQIAAENKMEHLGYYSPQANAVVLNLSRPEGEIIGTLAHELRHAWQYENSFWSSKEMSPRDNVLMLHAQEADAEAVGVLVCWELKQAGHPSAFEAHKKSGYGDISTLFEQKALAKPESVADGSAMRDAYDQWFHSQNRTVPYAVRTVEMILGGILSFARQCKKGFTALTHDFLTGMGELPGGTNYQKNAPARDLASKTYTSVLTPDLEEMMGIIDRGIGLEPPPANDNGKDPVASLPIKQMTLHLQQMAGPRPQIR